MRNSNKYFDLVSIIESMFEKVIFVVTTLIH